jgi:hypothetical protein
MDRGAGALRPAVWIAAVTTVLVGAVLQLGGTLALVAAGGCALALFVLVVLAHRTRSDEPLNPATLLVTALILALVFSVGITLRSAGESGVQSFALYALAKRLTLPVVLLLVGIFALALLSRREARARMPAWWVALAAILLVSTTASILVSRQTLGASDALQGLALLIGVLLLSWFGLQTRRWSHREEQLLLATLFAGAAVSGLLVTGLTPFVTLLIPASFAALYLGLTAPRHRGRYALAALVLWALMANQLIVLNAATSGGLSMAVAGEVVGCVVLLGLYLTPRAARPALAAVAGVVAAVALVRSGLIDLLTGNWQRFPDVTLAHRGYETQQVLDLLGQSPVSLLLGLGPAGTVDLSASPDAGTLAAAGRVLAAVDDVHLLSSWLLLKMGVGGLVWAVLFGMAVVRLTSSLLRSPEAHWDRALLMFVAAGVVSSLPAATNLFTNPLPMLAIGLLMARATQRRLDAEAAGPLPADEDERAAVAG